jgi:hypothetical protein
MPSAQGYSGPGGPARAVVVVSDLSLVAEAVAAALRSRGLPARCGTWPPDKAVVQAPGVDDVVIGLAVIEQAAVEQSVSIAASLVEDGVHWIVVTAEYAGPPWGPRLAARGAEVLPHSSSLDDVVAAVQAVSA